ncbi:MAG: ABC transporter permease [archaeon YNP-LCB-003-016]|uniref:ABC transporter permease n=1 Tax=Candidatus Culexarchaeum yellowstonense TaxID=2928963 RepID=UPI0026EE4FA7|nr:ABC transporter permease [Candidatus Culexarchaeum yellowstonense]MCR6692083.1 ABC transporter permease [Candidatus Culexarchaeum yellowstonense]
MQKLLNRKTVKERKAGMLHIAWRRFKKNKVSIAGAIITLTIAGIAILAPLISPYNPEKLNYGKELQPPSWEFLLGTDTGGRDILSYIIWGARTSLLVAIGAILIEVAIGVLIGAIAGYFGGIIDEILMRITDIIMTLPTILLLLTAVSMFKVRSIVIITLIMGALGWPWMARIVRSEFLSLKESLFVEAAKSLGIGKLRIIFHHILPNAISPIIVVATLDAPFYIMYEATLSFLGLGDPTAISWGNLVARGKDVLTSAWWVATFPGLMIFITTIGLNLLGDGLRDAFDVRARI